VFCIKGLAVPIYAYRCAECGHAKDVLQKLSDPVLSTCPACGKDSFAKQLTAAGFQLKGSGWYVTDFRGGNNAGNGKAAAAGTAAAAAEGTAKADAGAAAGSTTTTSSSAASSSDGGGGGSASSGGCGSSCACH
jgi:putative FmdB family regulatory protein